AVDDRVDGPQDAEERAATASILAGPADETRDLDELDRHAADPGQGGHRAERRERVVTGLDLDLGQRLEQGRLAHVGWPDEGDLGGALASHRDRIAVDRARPDPRVRDLGLEPL